MARHPDNPHGWFYNGLGRLVDGMLPGSQFDVNTGNYSNIGEGVIGAIGDSILPGLGTIGTKIWDRNHPANGGFMGGQGNYSGSFFDGGAGLSGNSGFGGFSLAGNNFSGSMPGGSPFGSGYGTPGNILAPATQVGPFGNTQTAPGNYGGGEGGQGGGNVGMGQTGMNSGGNKFGGARYGWGGGGVNSSGGPNYT